MLIPILNETPAGTVGGGNVIFTLARTPVAGSLRLYLKQFRQDDGVHYSLSGKTITMFDPPDVGDYLNANYITSEELAASEGLISVLNETPAGVVGGGNFDFTLLHAPARGSLRLYLADEKLTIAGVIGNYADVYCDGERYHVFDYNGVLTKAA